MIQKTRQTRGAEFMANADKVFGKEADDAEKIRQSHEQEKVVLRQTNMM